MTTWRTEQLGYCQACTESGYVGELGIEHYATEDITTKTKILDGCYIQMLRSYNSIVAIAVDGQDVYLLPRYNYSPTTSRQLTRWLREMGYSTDRKEHEQIARFELNGTGWREY